MIREMIPEDRNDINEMQFELQKFFSKIDQTHESLSYQSIDGAHYYMQKMIDDVKSMNGKIFVAEKITLSSVLFRALLLSIKKEKTKSMTCLIIRQKRVGLVCYI